MRIGTWNLRLCPPSTSETGQAISSWLDGQKADVWLLTEVHRDWDPRGGSIAVSPPRSFDPEAPKRWAGIETRLPLTPVSAGDDHPGEEGLSLARIEVDGRQVLVACSVLPWSGAGKYWHGLPKGQIDQFAFVLDHHVSRISAERRDDEPLVWGGDFNQPLRRLVDETTIKGVATLQAAFESLELTPLTADAEHLKGRMRSIDHIAVSHHFDGGPATTHRPERAGGGDLSDHAAYTADVVLA